MLDFHGGPVFKTPFPFIFYLFNCLAKLCSSLEGGRWDLSSSTRDVLVPSAAEAQNLNCWTTMGAHDAFLLHSLLVPPPAPPPTGLAPSWLPSSCRSLPTTLTSSRQRIFTESMPQLLTLCWQCFQHSSQSQDEDKDKLRKGVDRHIRNPAKDLSLFWQ